MSCSREPGTDLYMICPYNKSHRILKSRFMVHLIKCRKSFKDIEMVTCPFNTSHVIHEPELNWHVTVCENRSTITKYKYTVDTGSKNDSAPPALHDPIESSENWDDVDAQSYNPQNYVSNAPIIRNLIGALPSERKKFRRDERIRLNRLQE